ncbi:hypothetical protein BDR26DRAFT_669151 [Obelidium mucronatum]|nr:hypothetical protein BDR26DRAFT_669151 [Obelidium mucronatum]
MLKKIGQYSPEFELPLFVTKLGESSLPIITDEVVVHALTESNAKLSPKQYYHVQEAIVPGKPLVATKAFQTVADAVHKIGIKPVLGGVLPSLGCWVGEKKGEALTVATLQNSASDGWLSRFLLQITKFSPSFDVSSFAAKMSSISDLTEDRALTEMSNCGANLTDAQFATVLEAVNPESPQEGLLAFKALGRAYRDSSDAQTFAREVLPAALVQTLSPEELRVLEKLQKSGPTGWWARFLDGVLSYSPSFDLVAFSNALATMPSESLDSSSIHEILSESQCRLSKSELQHIEDQMAPGQHDLVLASYKNVGAAIKEIGPGSFANIVSPILAKAEKNVKKRNRVLRIVSSSKTSGDIIKPINVRRDSVKDTPPTKVPVKRLSFAGTPEVVRTPSRGSLAPIVARPVHGIEDKGVKGKSSREVKQRVPSVPEITRLPSPPTIAQELNVKPKSSVVSFSQTEAVVEPVVTMVRTESVVSLDELFPVDTPITRRRSTASGSIRSMDSSIDKRRSYLEYLTDSSSISSLTGNTKMRKRVESPEDTILAMSLARKYSGIVSQGWWANFMAYAQSLHPGFDGFEFVSKLAENEAPAPMGDDVLQKLLAQSGAPVTQKELEQLKSKINASPSVTSDFFTSLGPIIRNIGSRRFLYKILPIWSNADSVDEVSFSQGIDQFTANHSEFKPDAFGFITQCQKSSPVFDVTKFFDAISTIQGTVTEEKLGYCFKHAGIDAPASEYKRLTTVLLGFWSLDALRDYGSVVYSIGVPNFVASLSSLGSPSEEQCKHAGMAWISSLNEMGPKAKFDPVGFQNACRAIDPVFNLESFLVKLMTSKEINDDSDIRAVFKESGLNMTDAEYNDVMIATCGSLGPQVHIFRSWWQFIRLWGIQLYFDTIDGVLAEQRTKNALVRTFLGRIYALGPNVQFNLRGFVASCKAYNPEFSLQVFCDNLRSISRLEEDSLYDAFVASGITMDRSSIEYSELQTTLFGDYHLSMTAFRELHYLLKKLGSEWSVIYMWALVDQRQQVEQSVMAFKASIQDVKVAIGGQTTPLKFTMRSFIERCKNSQSGWHTDGDSFDLKMLLEKLSKMSSEGDIAGNLISVFKSCGIYLTVNEYENLIGSISGGDYTSGLVVFKMLIDFLKKWGIEWNMWIVWSLMDDKESNEDEMMEFILRVRELGPEAKFDLLQFIERCESLENSWHSESSFNIEVFINELLNVQGELSLASLETIYRLSGIRTTTEEYIDLTTTLTGGKFETTAIPVITCWIRFLHLWGVQWFLRASTNFFERVQESDKEIERLDLALTITNNSLDLRSFVWFCETRYGGFKIAPFLEGLIIAADLTHSVVLDLLAEQHIELTDAELLNLVGLLTGAEGEESFNVLHQWVLVLRTCTVKYYLFLWRLECMWKVTGVDVPLSVKAFNSRIKFQAPEFSVDRLVSAVKVKKPDWEIEKFVGFLVQTRGELNVTMVQEAFKATGVEATFEEAVDMLSDSVREQGLML